MEAKPLLSQKNNIFFSIVIPAYNEEADIEKTCLAIIREFTINGLSDYEILVINDNSKDGTEQVLKQLTECRPQVRYLNSQNPNGFGFAVRYGLKHFQGECVCIVMADLSDSPQDILQYYWHMKMGHECVFGSRFIKGSRVIDYPKLKLILNRLANYLIKSLFRIDHNDITNAFKCYRREVIEGLDPILSHHFNLTIEMPLKSIIRGYNFIKVPISWTGRKTGVSKLKIKEMGSRYLFILLYVLVEKFFSKGDYHRSMQKKIISQREIIPSVDSSIFKT